jgi:hypothetical protein
MERVPRLRGVARTLASGIFKETRLARAPNGVESAADQLQRLVDAHKYRFESRVRLRAKRRPPATAAPASRSSDKWCAATSCRAESRIGT